MNPQLPVLDNVVSRLSDGLLRGISPLERIGSNLQMMPVAGASGRAFHGINRWALIVENRRDPRWFTQQQAEHLGARLRDGEKGVKLVFWKRTEEAQTEMRIFTVFNAEQFDGLTDLPDSPAKQVNFEAVRAIFRNCGCRFEATDKTAFYSPERDVIFAPQSKDEVERVKRLFDVLNVVIERQSALGQGTAPKGTRQYTEESLTRAIASLLTAHELRLPYNDMQDRAYYRDWAKFITANPVAFMRVASQAEQICRNVLSLANGNVRAVDAVEMPHDWNGKFEIRDLPDGGVELSALCYGGKSAVIGSFDNRDQAQAMQWQLTVLHGSTVPTRRDYLVVAWQDREQVRGLGAKFDPAAKSWYVPEGLSEEERDKLSQWRPRAYSERLRMMARETQIKAKESKINERVILDVPFAQKDRAKAAGALFDPERKQWFVSLRGPLEGVKRWLPEKYKELAVPYCPPGALQEKKKLYVPYEQIYLAKSKGAVWNPQEKTWYAPAGSFEKDFEDWTKEPVQPDPKQEFLALLIKHGFDPERNPPVMMDGKKHRYATTDDKRGNESGEYKAYLDLRPAGMIRNFKTGAYETWSSRKTTENISAERLEELRREALIAKQKREEETIREQQTVAERAAGMYAALTEQKRQKLTCYEIRKGLDQKGCEPDCGAIDKHGSLVLPVQDVKGKIWSLQFISDDGTKKFLKGGRKRGCFSVVFAKNAGNKKVASAETVIVSEGYATAMSVSQSTGMPVIVAFDAGNLMAVCREIHRVLPAKPILIAGDDDYGREQDSGINPGKEKALAVTREPDLAGYVQAVFPSFPGDVQEEKNLTDFNDLAATCGLYEVSAQIESALSTVRNLQSSEVAPKKKDVVRTM